MGFKPTVVFDFDGVIHSYSSGWKGADVIADPPVPGVKEAIENIRKQYKVVVVSSRCETPEGLEAIKDWLSVEGIVIDDVCATKPPAIVYIDDRAICFDGVASSLLEQINTFQPWNKRG